MIFVVSQQASCFCVDVGDWLLSKTDCEVATQEMYDVPRRGEKGYGKSFQSSQADEGCVS